MGFKDTKTKFDLRLKLLNFSFKITIDYFTDLTLMN